jgi:hypothetical protein
LELVQERHAVYTTETKAKIRTTGTVPVALCSHLNNCFRGTLSQISRPSQSYRDFDSKKILTHNSIMVSQQSKPRKVSRSRNRVHANLMDELNDLKLSSYKPGHTLHAIRKTAERQNLIADLTPQERAILAAPHSPGLNQEDVEDFVKGYFPILDRMYFFNSIKKNFKGFKFFPRNSTDFIGLWDPETSLIHLEYRMSLSDGQSPGQAYICTLVHEMLHAFLDMYTCECDSCTRTNWAGGPIYETSEGEEPAGGHGPLWANCMLLIQESMTRELGWQVRCKIDESVQEQMKERNWQPKDHQLVRWGLGHLAGQPQSTRQPHSTRHQMEPSRREESDDESDEGPIEEPENEEGQWVICCFGYTCCHLT